MIAFSFFLFALIVLTWLKMPGGERRLTVETPSIIQAETQSV